MKDTNAVIAAYDNHSAAEDAVKELQKSGFDIRSCLSWAKIIIPTSRWLATTTRETA
jgi:N6-adenosine-specific RNA methylase IME4